MKADALNACKLRIVVAGGSFTGLYLARHYRRSVDVFFLSRTPNVLIKAGMRAGFDVPGDFRADAILDTIPANDHNPHPHASALEGLDDCRLIHISSTSVYPGEGQVFYEEEYPSPDGSRGLGRLELERRIKLWWGEKAHVIRAGGIYGPGRCLATRFRDGNFDRVSTENRIVSRIHVHDLVRLILAVASANVPPPLLNAVDPRPSPNRDTYSFIEERLRIRIPGGWRDGPEVGRSIASRYAKRLIGAYAFPDFRAGYEDCLRRDF